MFSVQLRPPLRPAAVGALATAALLAPAPSPILNTTAAAAHEPVALAARSCSGARARISKAAPRKLRSALLCLVNRKRAAHGLRPLRPDRSLRARPAAHARDMVTHGYFAHQRAGGPDPTARLAGPAGTAAPAARRSPTAAAPRARRTPPLEPG